METTSESWHVLLAPRKLDLLIATSVVSPYDGVEAEVGVALLGLQIRGVRALVPVALQTFGEWS
jgi:hypothetical protein